MLVARDEGGGGVPCMIRLFFKLLRLDLDLFLLFLVALRFVFIVLGDDQGLDPLGLIKTPLIRCFCRVGDLVVLF